MIQATTDMNLEDITLRERKEREVSCTVVSDPMDCSPPGPLSMGFSRQEYWRGLPFPSPGDLPDPGIEPRSPTFQADALTSEPPGKPIQIKENL